MKKTFKLISSFIIFSLCYTNFVFSIDVPTDVRTDVLVVGQHIEIGRPTTRFMQGHGEVRCDERAGLTFTTEKVLRLARIIAKYCPQLCFSYQFLENGNTPRACFAVPLYESLDRPMGNEVPVLFLAGRARREGGVYAIEPTTLLTYEQVKGNCVGEFQRSNTPVDQDRISRVIRHLEKIMRGEYNEYIDLGLACREQEIRRRERNAIPVPPAPQRLSIARNPFSLSDSESDEEEVYSPNLLIGKIDFERG